MKYKKCSGDIIEDTDEIILIKKQRKDQTMSTMLDEDYSESIVSKTTIYNHYATSNLSNNKIPKYEDFQEMSKKFKKKPHHIKKKKGWE